MMKGVYADHAQVGETSLGATKAKISALQANLDRVTPLARSMHYTT
jgi:hypothetical protein